MLRVVLLILALAVYGAYALVGNLASGNSGPANPGTITGLPTDKASLAEMAANAVGLSTQELPAAGCSASMLDDNNLGLILNSLPPAQEAALANMLNASSGVWTAQLYYGQLGLGLCLPTQGRLVLLPGGAETLGVVGRLVSPLLAN